MEFDRAFRWSEVKREVYNLAREAAETVSVVAAGIFAECAQHVKTGFAIDNGGAEVWVGDKVFEISGHAPEKCLSSHWTGSLEEWEGIEEQIRRLLDKKIVREELAARL